MTIQLTVEQSNRGITAAVRATVERKMVLVAVAVLSCGIAAWAVVNIANGWVGFARPVPVGFRGGMEAGIALARLFAALVLVLIVVDGVGRRLRWVALGFVVLGLGQLVFGYAEPILDDSSDLNRSLYEMILVRSVAAALFIVGLVPVVPPRLTWRATGGIAVFCCVAIGGYLVFEARDAIPALVSPNHLDEEARLGIAPMSWMTGWHWIFAAFTFLLAGIAAVGALTRYQRAEIGTWLPIGIVLLAGSELHDALWPSAYGNSVLLSTADLLRLAMAVVVVVGGAMELRRITSERTALLRSEQNHVRRLEELAKLKADFTAMVAHELGYPLSAIRRLTEMLSRTGVESELQRHVLASIIKETSALDALVADVQATVVVEREDFGLELCPIAIGTLIEDAELLAKAHAGGRPPLTTSLVDVDACDRVSADRARIGQVLRNLLCNAAMYSPPGTEISLRMIASPSRRIRVEVIDRGEGIHPDDLTRIFDKYGRGRTREGGHISGTGLGLYLSRRIVRGHGSDLTVYSHPGVGSVFAFELKRSTDAAIGGR